MYVLGGGVKRPEMLFGDGVSCYSVADDTLFFAFLLFHKKNENLKS